MRVQSNKTEKLLLEIDHLIRTKMFTKVGQNSNWRTIDQEHAYKVKKTINILNEDLMRLSRDVVGRKKGRKPSISVDQKVRILLVKQLLGESNRKMTYMLVVFSTISGIFMGYKSIERFYSDSEVYKLLFALKDTIYSKY